MGAPAIAPRWEKGFLCELERIVNWLDPGGANQPFQEALNNGCTSITTAKGKVVGPGGVTREYRLCLAHFGMFGASPAA